jgi:hypothetical protein
VTFPFYLAFLALLAAFMIYAAWAGLDPRILIGGGLLLLLVSALLFAGGATGVADTLSSFVFFLIAGGAVLLLVDHVRRRGFRGRGRSDDSGLRGWHADPSETTQERQGPAEQSLERSE